MSVKNSVNKLLFYILIFSLALGCQKVEGTGGTSTIKGQVLSQKYSVAEAEITELILTNGTQVEHGDYWLLNTPDTDKYYYVWYDNPSWITDGDPSLNGRIGVKVTFNYSNSNLELASKTKAAILSQSNAFRIDVLNDILLLENLQKGEVPDANELTTPFEINIKAQGRERALSNIEVAIDEKVYITYGQSGIYNDVVRTGPDGKFQLNFLTIGDYKIYVNSVDTITHSQVPIELEVQILEKKSIIELGTIKILQ